MPVVGGVVGRHGAAAAAGVEGDQSGWNQSQTQIDSRIEGQSIESEDQLLSQTASLPVGMDHGSSEFHQSPVLSTGFGGDGGEVHQGLGGEVELPGGWGLNRLFPDDLIYGGSVWFSLLLDEAGSANQLLIPIFGLHVGAHEPTMPVVGVQVKALTLWLPVALVAVGQVAQSQQSEQFRGFHDLAEGKLGMGWLQQIHSLLPSMSPVPRKAAKGDGNRLPAPRQRQHNTSWRKEKSGALTPR